jgi:menaquinone-dependent protoporphyrinogen oxidase
MNERVLIAYGSKHGSVAETADAIAGMLRERGLEADISEAGRVHTLNGYSAVIVAGSIYAAHWHPETRAFVKRYAEALALLPVAIFAMGPKTSGPNDLASAREQLNRTLKRLPDIGAEPIAIFGGVIDPAKLHFPFNRLPVTDARDWKAISTFADQFAERLAVPVGSGDLEGASGDLEGAGIG